MSATIIAIANQKGGAGKTTTAASMGSAFTRRGHRTLLVDCDPQGSPSASLGYKPCDNSITLATIISQVIMNEAYSRL